MLFSLSASVCPGSGSTCGVSQTGSRALPSFPFPFENIRAVLFIHALAGVIVADEWADPVTFAGAQRQIKMQQTEFAKLITRHVACSHASLPARSRTKHLLSELTALIHFY